jgi:DnaJ-class molecular chaperone
MSNYYDILEVSKESTDEEIKKSYRRLSLQYHPDRNPSPEASEKIREINTAYETLGDKEARKKYDNPPSAQSQMFFHTNFHENGGHVDLGNMGNIFQSMFGGMGGGMNPEMFQQHIFQQLNKPPPIVCNITITMSQSYNGCVIPVEINKWEISGNTRQTKMETIYVTVPEGIDANEIIILRERGNTVNEELKGDIKIFINISKETAPELEFERAGMDLIYRRKITLKEALCGFSFHIKHLNGSSYCVKNTTNIVSPNQKQVIPKLGIKREGNMGNLIIEYIVVFPESLDASKIEILKEIL